MAGAPGLAVDGAAGGADVAGGGAAGFCPCGGAADSGLGWFGRGNGCGVCAVATADAIANTATPARARMIGIIGTLA